MTTSIHIDFNRLGSPKIISYNCNCNPNRKIFMTIKPLCDLHNDSP